MSKYLGNNFWLMKDGKVFNTKTQVICSMRNLPPTMKWKKSAGKYKVEEGTDFHNMKQGHKFVMFDFCEDVRSHKKTTNAVFMKFTTLNKCWRKYESVKEKNGWIYFDYEFYPKKAYRLLCEIDHNFRDSIRILKYKELKNENYKY